MSNDRTEWLKWRHQGTGASEAAALYDEHPNMTKLQLHVIKSQKEFKEDDSNAYIKNVGNTLEPIARSRFSALYNIENGTDETFDPRRVELKDLDFIKASLDGCSRDGKVLAEFKFMSKPIEKDKELTEGQQKHIDVLEGKIPRHYWIQIQHQLLASGADECHFVSFDGESLHTTIVMPDVDFIKNHIKVCTDFWMSVKEGDAPEASKDDLVEIKDAAMKDKCKEWKKLKVKLDDIEEKIKVLREDILKDVKHPHSKCAGVGFTLCAGRAGAIDYTKIMSLPQVKTLGIDPEQYRKAASKPSWKVEIL